MKVLIIDHLASDINNRKLYDLLSEKIELTLLIPSKWKENYSDIKNINADNENYKIILGDVFFSGRPHMMIFKNKIINLIKNKPDIIYINSEPENFLTLQILILKKIFSPKSKIIIVSWRNIQYNFFKRSVPYKASLLYLIIENFTLKYVDGLRAMTETAKTKILEKNYKKQIKIIPWGVDTDLFKNNFDKNLKTKLKLKEIVFGYMGRLVKSKGIYILLDAVSQINDINYSILIIGNGPEFHNIIKYCENKNIKNRLCLIKTVEYKEVVKYLSLMNILLLPSLTTKKWKEQFGRIIIEAQACKIPVIGSDSGEIPKVINNSDLIFKENDVKSLKEKIYFILNSENRNKIIEDAYNRILTNFSWEIISKKMISFFNIVLNNVL